MSIYKKQTLIEQSPAFNVYRREPSRYGGVEISAGEKLGLKKAHRLGDYHRAFMVGSVVSYALQYNEDPIAAVARSIAAGDRLQWINACSSVITAERRDAEDLIEVTIGMRVRFEGVVSTVEADHNDNLKLVPVEVAK